MVLTLKEVADHIEDQLELSPAGTNRPELLVNEAGVAWCNASGWAYLRRRVRDIELSTAATVYPLGADFRELESIVDPEFPVWEPDLMPRSEFEVYKKRIVTATDTWWAGTIYDSVVSEVPQKVLELFPVPRTARTLTITYTAGWTRVDETDDVIDLPQQLEPAFVGWIRHYAEGREKRKDINEHMAAFKRSPVFMDAEAREGAELPFLEAPLGQSGERFFRTTTAKEVVWGPYGPRLRRPFGRT